MKRVDLSHWDVTETPSCPGRHPGRAVSAKCLRCATSIHTWLPERASLELVLADHERQHAPGNALDITVEWKVIADCSVCEDGGKVDLDSDGDLMCEKCGTYWSSDGTGGLLADAEV